MLSLVLFGAPPPVLDADQAELVDTILRERVSSARWILAASDPGRSVT